MLTLLPQSNSMSVSLSGNELPDIVTKKSRKKSLAVIVPSIGMLGPGSSPLKG